MNRLRLTVQAIVAITACHAASAQLPAVDTFPVKRCDQPKSPFGILLRSTGRVAFRLGTDGRPDTASLMVERVLGMSVAAYRSAAARRLSACRFDVDRAALHASVTVVDQADTDSIGVTIGVAREARDTNAALRPEPLVVPKDSFPLPFGDRRLEERPRQLSCKPFSGQPPPQLPPSARQRAAAAVSDAQRPGTSTAAQSGNLSETQKWNVTYAGTLVAIVRAGVDGKPGSAVRVVSVTNPSAVNRLAELIGGCEFAPGRYRGVAVPSFLLVTVTVPEATVP